MVTYSGFAQSLRLRGGCQPWRSKRADSPENEPMDIIAFDTEVKTFWALKRSKLLPSSLFSCTHRCGDAVRQYGKLKEQWRC